jgi:hypothetical protein
MDLCHEFVCPHDHANFKVHGPLMPVKSSEAV